MRVIQGTGMYLVCSNVAGTLLERSGDSSTAVFAILLQEQELRCTIILFICYIHATMKDVTITKEKFVAYEAVRQLGVTNMFDMKVVRKLASVPLTDEDCHDMMKNHLLYKEKYM